MNEVLERILKEKARVAIELGATTELVGCWVWAKFETRPAPEVRERMLEAYYKWNAKRGVWQYAGIPCHGSPAESAVVKAKYGARTFAPVPGRAAVPTPEVAATLF